MSYTYAGQDAKTVAEYRETFDLAKTKQARAASVKAEADARVAEAIALAAEAEAQARIDAEVMLSEAKRLRIEADARAAIVDAREKLQQVAVREMSLGADMEADECRRWAEARWVESYAKCRRRLREGTAEAYPYDSGAGFRGALTVRTGGNANPDLLGAPRGSQALEGAA